MLFLKVTNGATVNANFFGPGLSIDVNTTHYIPMSDIGGFRSNNNSDGIDWFYYKPHGSSGGDTDDGTFQTTRWAVGTSNDAETFTSAEIVSLSTELSEVTKVATPGRFTEQQ